MYRDWTLNKFTAFLELPSLSCSSFFKTLQTSIAEIVHETAWEEMQKADKEENKKDLDCGDIDIVMAFLCMSTVF